MTKDDIIFIEQNIINFERVKLGFVTNLMPNILNGYQDIYRRNIDPHFVVTPWCPTCVISMLERLSNHYDNYIQQNKKPIKNANRKQL